MRIHKMKQDYYAVLLFSSEIIVTGLYLLPH